jgi:hypothetical protein
MVLRPTAISLRASVEPTWASLADVASVFGAPLVAGEGLV